MVRVPSTLCFTCCLLDSMRSGHYILLSAHTHTTRPQPKKKHKNSKNKHIYKHHFLVLNLRSRFSLLVSLPRAGDLLAPAPGSEGSKSIGIGVSSEGVISHAAHAAHMQRTHAHTHFTFFCYRSQTPPQPPHNKYVWASDG